MSADLIAEGLNTLFVVCRAILAWIIVLSALATLLLVGLVLGIDWAWHAITGPPRTEPAGQTADTHEYQEAA